MQFEIIRDPLWNNIRVDPFAMRLLDTRAVQRLRYVRQLGLTFLVYPGATHSRFEHALGTYHLARRTLALLAERHDLETLPVNEPAIIRAAALLHDVGHYPFSHALEEIGVVHHETVARPLVTEGAVAALLRAELGEGAPRRVIDLIARSSPSPLQGLISGSLDLDKIEYLKRDALMCGVPYGEINVDRLTHSLTLLDDPETGRQTIGVEEKGLAALESLLFAKYRMYRNVYWHHAVRSATAMYKRLVGDAVRSGAVREESIVEYTDEGLLDHLARTPHAPLVTALRERRLYKRALEWPASELPGDAEGGGGGRGWRGRMDRDRLAACSRGRGSAGGAGRARARRSHPGLSREDANAGIGHPRASPQWAHRATDERGLGGVDQSPVALRRAVSVSAVVAGVYRQPGLASRARDLRAADATPRRGAADSCRIVTPSAQVRARFGACD